MRDVLIAAGSLVWAAAVYRTMRDGGGPRPTQETRMHSIATLAPAIVLAGLAVVAARVWIGRAGDQLDTLTADVRDRALEDLPPDLGAGLDWDGRWDVDVPRPGTGPARRREEAL